MHVTMIMLLVETTAIIIDLISLYSRIYFNHSSIKSHTYDFFFN